MRKIAVHVMWSCHVIYRGPSRVFHERPHATSSSSFTGNGFCSKKNVCLRFWTPTPTTYSVWTHMKKLSHDFVTHTILQPFFQAWFGLSGKGGWLGILESWVQALFAAELTPGGIDSACHPSEVGEMSTCVLVSGHSISGVVVPQQNDSYSAAKLPYSRRRTTLPSSSSSSSLSCHATEWDEKREQSRQHMQARRANVAKTAAEQNMRELEKEHAENMTTTDHEKILLLKN